MEVKIVIDGKEVILAEKRMVQNGSYQEFGEPEPYASQGLGRSPLIVTAYVRPGWKPGKTKAKKRA